MAGAVVTKLHDQLGEIGFPGGDARVLERLVEPDLLGGHRLDLDHLVGARLAYQVDDDAVGFVGVTRPMDGRARSLERRL